MSNLYLGFLEDARVGQEIIALGLGAGSIARQTLRRRGI